MRSDGLAFGLDRLLRSLSAATPFPELPAEADAALRRGRVGLVTNPSAVTAELTPAADALLAAGCRLAALFGPEHGVRGDAPDGRPVGSGTDRHTGLPCHSLYGESRRPAPEMLRGLDALVVDIQDVGARFYTFESTLSLVMEACGDAGLPVIVLDRPNPIGGALVEGPLLEPQNASFVGLHPIPVRHGCTLGELAILFHRCFGVGEPPHVVRLEGWRRADGWPAGRPWVAPSPNMPTTDTALVYPGLCLIEGTSLSEGRGTTRPFEVFGAPWLEAEGLAARLNALHLPGVRFRPQWFEPAASKHAGELCGGAQAHVTDAAAFRPVRTGVEVLAALQELSGDHFEWRQWSGGVTSIDRLAGTAALRETVSAGRPLAPLLSEWDAQAAEFDARRRDLLLYP